MTDIARRVAFVTGGANGIGLGIARSLARAGAKLALVDLEAGALDRAKAELSALTDVFVAPLDIRDRDAFARIADAAEAEIGPVSILVNNAGVAGGAPANRLTFALWDWGIDINLGGVVNGVQIFLPRMIRRAAGGHIVNTSSAAGLVAGAGNTLYCTAKFAVTGLTEALCDALATDNIGVTLLCPGPVATDIIARTRALQPKVTRTMSADQRRRAFARSDEMKSALAKGVPPDAVGDMVVAAIRENRLYVHTDRSSFEGIADRACALLDAMPPGAGSFTGPPEFPRAPRT